MITGKNNMPDKINNGDDKEDRENDREDIVKIAFGGGTGKTIFENGIADRR